MQSNMTMNAQVMYMTMMEIAWKISRNGNGNAMICRYGCCSEEDIKRLTCDRAYHITGFRCTGEVSTTSRCEKGQCKVSKRLASCGKVRVHIIHGLTLAIKNSRTYRKSLLALKAKYYYDALRGRLVGVNHRAPRHSCKGRHLIINHAPIS